MTRETKIGLLVGLAFIIVIGILLSDHLTSSNEPPSAALGGAGNGVRQAVGSPGTSGIAAPVTVVTPAVTPQQMVATQGELTTPPPAVQIVKIGGPETNTSDTATSVAPRSDALAQQPAQEPSEGSKANSDQSGTVASNDTPPVTKLTSNPPIATDSELSKVAESQGEPLVLADGSKPAAAAAQSYVAQPGDSLSKIAAKFFGSGGKTNRDLIVKANPSLQANENMIIAGRSYQIPAAGKSAANVASKAKTLVSASTGTPSGAATAVDDSTAKTASATQAKSPKAASDAVYLYTVLPGDNLTRIARDEVGDVHAIAAIQELNPEKLKGANHDIVIAGSKLRLPGKPLVRAD